MNNDMIEINISVIITIYGIELDEKIKSVINSIKQLKQTPKTIEIIEIDELYSKYHDSKKKEQNESKYGLLWIDNKIKLLLLK